MDPNVHAIAAVRPLAPPAPKRYAPVLAVAAVLIVALSVAGVWIANRGGPAAPDAPREPISVLVANFKNDANDEVFDGLLEQAIAIGIEGAPFLTMYPLFHLPTASGEATAVFLDDVPSYFQFPPVLYYLALAQRE